MHQAAGAKFVAFAGYDMPVQYAAGVMAEHLHTRQKAGLFDVSHMGQLRLPLAATDVLERVTACLIGVPLGKVSIVVVLLSILSGLTQRPGQLHRVKVWNLSYVK